MIEQDVQMSMIDEPPTDGVETMSENEPTAPTEIDATEKLPAVDLDSLPGGLKGAVEAILMVIDEPVTEVHLASALDVPVLAVTGVLDELAAEYYGADGSRPRGFELRHVAGGWRVYSHPAYAVAVDRFVMNGQTSRLTQAALETLAVIAYRQPVSRGRISSIRGVNVDGVVRTLMARGLIEESGEESESGAVLYQTSSYFLERMGIQSLDELAPLAPYLPDMEILDDINDEVNVP